MPNLEPIRQSRLFDSLSPAQFASLLEEASEIHFPPASIILHEGEIGDACFIVLRGSVQVFTTRDGREIVIDRREPGAIIGEQALLPGSSGRRNASLRALDDVTLLRISKTSFLSILSRDHPLGQRLHRIGEAQAQNILVRQSAIFRALPLNSADQDWYREESFTDGQIVFRQGDPPDRVYVVITGAAGVYQPDLNGQRLILRVGPGRTFGEMGILDRAPRSATVVAHGDLRVLSIDGEHFTRLVESTPAVREYMRSLKRVYPLGQGGFVTQYLGRFLDMDCLTTVATLPDGASVASSLVIGQDIFNLSVVGGDAQTPESVRFQDEARGIDRELRLIGPRIVGVTAHGEWEALGLIYRMVLDATPVEPWRLDLFRQTGWLQPELTLPIYQDHEIVCQCLAISRGTLRSTIAGGAASAEQLSEITGAGTVCGGCRPLIRELLGHADWLPVRVDQVLPITPDIRAFRFTPFPNGTDRAFKPARPGQHVIVQSHIAGRWIQRPYTISSPADETTYREITVKREPQGLFSRWLFDDGWKGALVRLSDPQGEYHADLTRPNPIVCLVGGIGLTPALAIVRSAIRAGATQPVYIDYSVSSRDQCAYGDELLAVAASHPNIKVNLRLTREHGRLTQADVRRLTRAYPNADFFVCGPTLFQAAAEKFLRAARVPARRVHVEVFTPVGAQPAPPSRRYVVVGLALLLLFAAQELLGLKLPAFEALQAAESYKQWTGVLLLLYITAQFALTAVRARSDTKATARHYQLHKWVGAFAPLAFYLHSTSMGYAYLLFLNIVYFANVGLGLFNHEVAIPPRHKPRYSRVWLVLHVALAVILAALVVAHIYVVYAYQ